MNFLAHAYLSFNIPEIVLGNMVSDFIKGRQKFAFSPAIQNGINLHRAIDEFTDAHPVTKEAKQLFRPAYGLYAGAFMDIVYDHFLATDTATFTEKSLMQFSQHTYNQLENLQEWFPGRFALMFPYMKKQNWLFHYKDRSGIHNSMKGLIKRARYMNDSEPAIEIFEKHYQNFYEYYHQFFPEIKTFAENYLARAAIR